MGKKEMLPSDTSTQKQIDLETITPESFQKMSPSEREQVREVVVRQSSDVREFSQNFLETLGASLLRKDGSENHSSRRSRIELSQPRNI